MVAAVVAAVAADSGAIFELIYWVLRLCIYYPQIGLPLVGGIVAWLIYSAYKQQQNKDWDSGPPVDLERAIDLRRACAVSIPTSRRSRSRTSRSVCSRRHIAHAPAPTRSRPSRRMSADRTQLARESRTTWRRVAASHRRRDARISRRGPGSPRDQMDRPTRVRIGIEFEANVATADHTYFSVESWLFGRDAAITQAARARRATFACPNCGAPWQSTGTGTQRCAHCDQIVDNGRFDWVVEQISLSSLDERPPTLTTEVPERGTDLPTYVQPAVRRSVRRDRARRCRRSIEHALDARLQLIYAELTKAWTSNELAPIRGFVSDGLFDYLSYWVDAYKRQGLRNELVDMRITRVELAKVTRDRWYDAVTFRMWATGKDYVVRGSEVVRGSQAPRAPVQRVLDADPQRARAEGPTKTDRACGNCGAPLKIRMAGDVRVLQRARHRRRVRLGALEDRAGRLVSRLIQNSRLQPTAPHSHYPSAARACAYLVLPRFTMRMRRARSTSLGLMVGVVAASDGGVAAVSPMPAPMRRRSRMPDAAVAPGIDGTWSDTYITTNGPLSMSGLRVGSCGGRRRRRYGRGDAV